jgi:four helix bundle protein
MSDDNKFTFQRLDIYVAAQELMVLVQEARIRDAEFRDQATRAAKSQFLNISEGLPFGSRAWRNRHFRIAKRSLFETVAAIDGAAAIDALDGELVGPMMARAHRIDAMLNRLIK